MEDARVNSIKQAILDLPAEQQQELAEEILPLLLTTQAAVRGTDPVVQALSDEEVDALVEQRPTQEVVRAGYVSPQGT
ncbi:MAG: hypothetical protein HY712_02675 [candidate division NC10 bacterium]|nr:hypothetical protein [candidate division NC10 bacterium]